MFVGYGNTMSMQRDQCWMIVAELSQAASVQSTPTIPALLTDTAPPDLWMWGVAPLWSCRCVDIIPSQFGETSSKLYIQPIDRKMEGFHGWSGEKNSLLMRTRLWQFGNLVSWWKCRHILLQANCFHFLVVILSECSVHLPLVEEQVFLLHSKVLLMIKNLP